MAFQRHHNRTNAKEEYIFRECSPVVEFQWTCHVAISRRDYEPLPSQLPFLLSHRLTPPASGLCRASRGIRRRLSCIGRYTLLPAKSSAPYLRVMAGSLTVTTFPHDPINILCRKCERHGRYRRQSLINKFGPHASMPDELAELASCPRRGSASDPCCAIYPDLGKWRKPTRE